MVLVLIFMAFLCLPLATAPRRRTLSPLLPGPAWPWGTLCWFMSQDGTGLPVCFLSCICAVRMGREGSSWGLGFRGRQCPMARALVNRMALRWTPVEPLRLYSGSTVNLGGRGVEKEGPALCPFSDLASPD